MEPVEAPVERKRLNLLYVVHTEVVRLEERKERVYLTGSGDKAEFTEVSLGWYASFKGSYEALHFGSEKPWFDIGDKIKITFQRQESP